MNRLFFPLKNRISPNHFLLNIGYQTPVSRSNNIILYGKRLFLPIIIMVLFLSSQILLAQSLDIPSKDWGLSIGNSKKFSGVRLNFRDHNVQQINGLNITLWAAKYNEKAIVNGISLGVLPEAGYLKGIQIGLAGVGAESDLKGISLGLIGAGSGKNVSGVAIGGLGVGSGGDVSGLMLGGLGAGAGGSIKGIAIGGLGTGAGGDITGIGCGLLGVGSGGNVKGILIGGLGAGVSGNLTGFTLGLLGTGAGENITGVTIGGIGAGAGENITGITVGGIGAGAGENVTGIAIGGIGAGAGVELRGITVGGLGAGAPSVKGLTLSLGTARGQKVQGVTVAGLWFKVNDDGLMKGLSISAFNQIKGVQNGISFGIFNWAWHLNGVQLGLINYVRDNPKFLKILPVINVHFD
jgi:hypothetical protein